ncbi:MAG TPA: TIM44-like domain-containing protein [Polyangiaceae bacterium]
MRFRAPLAVLAAIFALTLAPLALARPGGGGSYHGGGGGGGGGGGYHPMPSTPTSGVSGGGTPIGPVGIGILVGIIGIACVIGLVRQIQMARGPRADQFDPNARARASASLAPLQGRDPQLTEQSIAEHVRAMSEQLNAAWCAGEMKPARSFVSDGVYSRFQVQLALMRGENRRNVMGSASILAMTVESVEDAAPLDVVHVRFTAAARDTEVTWQASDAEIQQALAGAQANPYTEIWTVVRRQGAQSKPEGFEVGRACPSCGAPLDGGEVMKCRYCGATACSGEHDWVLAEITQLSEWRPTQGRPPGLDALRAADPAVSAEVLEDRASYLFWKWVEAGRANAATPLRKCAAPSFVAAGGALDGNRGASDVAVGGAEVCNVAAPGPDGFDRVDVRILWSARFGGGGSTPRRTIVRMARRTGVQSKVSMTALVCQACGAPVAETDTTKCEHCGAELAAGDQAWVLEGVSEG